MLDRQVESGGGWVKAPLAGYGRRWNSPLRPHQFTVTSVVMQTLERSEDRRRVARII